MCSAKDLWHQIINQHYTESGMASGKYDSMHDVNALAKNLYNGKKIMIVGHVINANVGQGLAFATLPMCCTPDSITVHSVGFPGIAEHTSGLSVDWIDKGSIQVRDSGMTSHLGQVCTITLTMSWN